MQLRPVCVRRRAPERAARAARAGKHPRRCARCGRSRVAVARAYRRGFVALVLGTDAIADLEGCRMLRVGRELGDPTGRVAATYGPAGVPRAWLIRPDGYLAAVGPTGGAAGDAASGAWRRAVEGPGGLRRRGSSLVTRCHMQHVTQIVTKDADSRRHPDRKPRQLPLQVGDGVWKKLRNGPQTRGERGLPRRPAAATMTASRRGSWHTGDHINGGRGSFGTLRVRRTPAGSTAAPRAAG